MEAFEMTKQRSHKRKAKWANLDHPFVQFAAEEAYRLRGFVELGSLITAAEYRDVHTQVGKWLCRQNVLVGKAGRFFRCRVEQLAKPLPRRTKASTLQLVRGEVMDPLRSCGFGLHPQRGAPRNMPLQTFLFLLLWLARASELPAPSKKCLHDLACRLKLAEFYAKDAYGHRRTDSFDRHHQAVARLRFVPTMREGFPPQAAALAHVVSEFTGRSTLPIPSSFELARHVSVTQQARPVDLCREKNASG